MSKKHEPTIEELIARKRAAGTDREFEDRLAAIWRCPHCKHETTIQNVLIDVANPDSEPACPKCEREGIQIAETRSQ